jgi:choline dehydrogenase-like flavoprotein
VQRPLPFATLEPEQQDLVLRRCESSRVFLLRLLFLGIKRLIANTWYGLPEARAEIGHLGALPVRAPGYAWEGALAGAAPVVAAAPREPAQKREAPPNLVERAATDIAIGADVCIIGSGVGGSLAASRLAEAGRDVVILEEGPFRTPADFSFDESAALRDLYADAGMRSTDDLKFSILQGRCAGGGSTVNWMVMLRTPDYVLEEWRTRHGTEDMGPAQMRDVFERFEREWNVGPVAAHAHSRANRILLDGCRALGWRAESANVNARDCMRSGMCGLGCPYDAKQTAVKTQLARALERGARMYSETRAERIARNGTAWTVHAHNSSGRAVTVNARTVVVAAGAVESPALLQRSGLGNRNVGRHLRLHPTTAVVGIYDEPVYAAGGIPLTAYCNEFVQLRGDYGHWIETPPLAAGLAAIALPGFGAGHRDYMKQYPYLAPLIVLVRDGSPDDPSRGAVQWQRSGRARVEYRLSEADRGVLIHGMESAARIHFAMGARSVLTIHRGEIVLRNEGDVSRIRAANATVGDPMLFSAHVNGTCRLGGNAADSACTPDGALRGARGVYVMDGSLLPTAPGVNPHETIAGMVDVLINRLVAESK